MPVFLNTFVVVCVCVVIMRLSVHTCFFFHSVKQPFLWTFYKLRGIASTFLSRRFNLWTDGSYEKQEQCNQRINLQSRFQQEGHPSTKNSKHHIGCCCFFLYLQVCWYVGAPDNRLCVYLWEYAEPMTLSFTSSYFQKCCYSEAWLFGTCCFNFLLLFFPSSAVGLDPNYEKHT